MRTMVPPWAPDPEVTVRPVELAGVSCIACEPPEYRSLSVYFHGGGYRLGAASFSAPFCTRLARRTNSAVIVVDYRLAPEYPFPAALYDAAAVYGQLLDQGNEKVVAIGDSAGGGLAAALVVAAATSGVPLPAGLVLMSGWLDLTCTASTYQSRAQSDQLFSYASAQAAAELYLQGHPADDPLASPGLACLDTWPPTMVLASTDEVLLDDSVLLTSAVARAGSLVTAVFEPGVPHAWPAVFPDDPASDVALAAISAFYAKLDQPAVVEPT